MKRRGSSIGWVAGLPLVVVACTGGSEPTPTGAPMPEVPVACLEASCFSPDLTQGSVLRFVYPW